MRAVLTSKRDYRLGPPWMRVVLYALLLLFSLAYLLPLFVMIVTSLKSVDEIYNGSMLSLPQAPSLAAWSKAWSSACVGLECNGIRTYFWNSFKIAIPAVLISTFLGAINGYVLTQWRFPGHRLVFGLMLFSCFIPYQSILIPMATLLGDLRVQGEAISRAVGFQTAIGTPLFNLAIVHIVYGIGFTTLFFRNYYEVFPVELIRAAQIDGAGFSAIFRRILLPNSVPILVVTVIYQFTGIWNDFLFGSSYAAGDTMPLTVALNNVVNTSTGVVEYNVNMATAVIAALPTLVVYIVAGRYFLRGLMAGSVKG